jgi:transcriptional regulator with XRE-family HTH domain
MTRNERRAMMTRWRERAGMSQRALAKKAGLSPSTVCRVEAGELVITFRTAKRIAGVFGKRPEMICEE